MNRLAISEDGAVCKSFIEQKRRNFGSGELMADGRYRRKVRSFVLRTGRISASQQQTFYQQWQHYGVDFATTVLDFKAVFGNDNPVVLEIGFGMGSSLITMAQQQPNCNYLGIEVHTPGVGACIAKAAHLKLSNLKLMCADATAVLAQSIADNSLAGLQLFFPDPWHKAKHHKRRIVQEDFIHLVVQKLQQGGFIHCASDWQDYAQHILGVLSDNQDLANSSPTGDFIERPPSRPITKFEQRGKNLGHGVWDLWFTKK